MSTVVSDQREMKSRFLLLQTAVQLSVYISFRGGQTKLALRAAYD